MKKRYEVVVKEVQRLSVEVETEEGQNDEEVIRFNLEGNLRNCYESNFSVVWAEAIEREVDKIEIKADKGAT